MPPDGRFVRWIWHMRILPCAILTHGRAEEELPVKLLRSIDTIYIGQYDDNRWAKSSSRYNDKFVYHITLLKKK